VVSCQFVTVPTVLSCNLRRRLGSEPHGEHHLPKRCARDRNLVLAILREGRAAAGHVGEDHLVAHLDSVDCAKQLVDVGFHGFHGIRRVVVERLRERVRHLVLAGAVRKPQNDPLWRVGLDDGVRI
jgi:hypothetical protein